MANEKKIKFKLKNEMFEDFISKLSNLTSIDDNIKLNIDNDHIYMYTILGGKVMLGFKNYLLNTHDYLELKDEINATFETILVNTKKFVKNLKFIEGNSKLELELKYKPYNDDANLMIVRTLQIKGDKLKINWISGQRNNINDISKELITDKLDLDNKNWSFTISTSDLEYIKKLSTINSNEIINFNISDNQLFVSEQGAWEIDLGEIEKDQFSFNLNKRFLKSITTTDDQDNITFALFDTFILIKDENSNLMLSYEQDFSYDEV